MAKVFAIGDMHGCSGAYLSLLMAAGLCDSSGRWAGGDSVLVQTGDLIDRGPGSLANLRLTRDLQDQARSKGGEVITLLGGHELFALAAADGNDWAFLNWFSAQNGGHSTMLEWLNLKGISTPRDDSSLASIYGEFLGEFSVGEFGAWLRGLPTAAVVGSSVFVHAGISREVPAEVSGLNKATRQALQDLRAYLTQDNAVFGRRGPFWVRDLRADEIERGLSANSARRVIIGHNPSSWITSRFDGRLIVIDTNVARGGVPLVLCVDGDEIFAIDSSARIWPIDNEPRASPAAPSRYAPGSSGGRFCRGDVVQFYHSPVSGGRAVLKILEIWMSEKETYYAGPLMAYIPERKGRALRFNPNEIWTFSGAFIDAVGTPVADVIQDMPPELSKATALLR